MELSTVLFLSFVLCGMGDVHAGESLEILTTRVGVVEQDLSIWKFSSTKTETRLMNKFHVWKESLKEELISTFLPSLIEPLVKQAITNILTEDDIGHQTNGKVLVEVHSLKDNVQYIKTRLRAITRDLRHVERERDTYRKSVRKERSELTEDIQALQMQVNETIDDVLETNQTLAGLTQDFRTLNTSCVVTEREIKSYREGLQEMRRNVSTDIRSLNIQLNQSISDQFHTNQTLAGLTQDFITLKTSCVVTEREIKSYREGLQEMRRNVSTDIRSLNIQLNQSISDQFHTNQTLAGLTQDFITLKTSCVVTEREIKSYREGLQEMRRNVSTDIRSLNIQLNQSISDQFHTNQTLAGLTQDFITLKTSCVVTEREIKSYREGLQEMRRNVSTDIQSLNIQLNQSISDQFDTNQTLAGLTQDFITLKTSCVVTEREIKSYREGLQEMRRNVSTDIRSLNIQLNQSISDQFHTNQTLAGLTQDF
ncbi:interaptin-like, partial [Haliotis asinina]|uniref:interaptin-like n=1 Tax=Haliotis asinina TaxID=109174 RepID=UPI00353279D1